MEIVLVKSVKCGQLLRVLVAFGGKPQQILGDKEEKLKRSRSISHLLFITAVPPNVTQTPF
jgi:hypothetical protein